MIGQDEISERRLVGAGTASSSWIGHAINLQTKEIRSTRPLAEPLDDEQLAPWLSESLGVAINPLPLPRPHPWRLSARVPFASGNTSNSFLTAYADWSFQPGFGSDGLLAWIPGRNVAGIQLVFGELPTAQMLLTVHGLVGTGQVTVQAGGASPTIVPGQNTDTTFFAVFTPASAVESVSIWGIPGLSQFSFYSANVREI